MPWWSGDVKNTGIVRGKDMDPSSDPGSYSGMDNAEAQARRQGYRGTLYQPRNLTSGSGQEMSRAISALQSGFSGTSDPTAQFQESLRSAALSRMGGLQNNAQGRKDLLKADLEQGFANQANILRRSAAGTGSQASLGYGRAAGDLANKFQDNMARSMLDVEDRMTGELGQLGGIGQQLFSQEMADREQQLQQAQLLSAIFQRMAGQEGANAAEEAARSAKETADRKAAQQQIIGAGMQLGTTAAMGGFGGPALLGGPGLLQSMAASRGGMTPEPRYVSPLGDYWSGSSYRGY